MRPVSERLLNIVTGSHTARTRVKLVTGFPQSTTPTGTALTLLSGDVKMDSSAVVRATLDCEVLAPWGTVLPDGSELFVEYGVEVAGGSTEWVALGYFRIDEVSQVAVNGPTRISASDRMQQVVDTEAVFPWVAPVGTTHADFFDSLLFGQVPTTWFHPNAGVFNSPAAQTIISDYDMNATLLPYQIPLDRPFYELLQGVADTIGKRMFFDYLGRLNVVDAALPLGGASVWTIEAGVDGTLRGLSRQITRDGFYNSVRAEGSAATEASPPWNYVVTPLANTMGSLSWYSRFGRILRSFSSPLLLTSAACLAAAQTLYDQATGLPYSLSMDTVPNPGLEPLDVVTVRFPGEGLSQTPPPPGMHVDPQQEVHVIDSLTFPLAGGDMSITTRGTTVLP